MNCQAADFLAKLFLGNSFMIRSLLIACGFLVLGACIGTDYVDDPIVGERIDLPASLLALKVGESYQATAIYYDQYGIEKPVTLSWTSSNPNAAEVDSKGIVKAISAGQTMIVASFETIVSTSLNITIVENNTQVASVEISSPSNKISLAIGESHSLLVSIKNIDDEILTGRTVEWFSENSSIATVSNGLVTGVSEGLVDIHAKVDGVKSNLLNFSIGSGLTGSFVGAGGYKAVGMAFLKEVEGNIVLEFSSNFETSFALGTFVYLANVTNGSQVKVNGFEVAQITSNGAKSFNLSALRPDIKLTDFKYVIILCKPASVTFGFAELK